MDSRRFGCLRFESRHNLEQKEALHTGVLGSVVEGASEPCGDEDMSSICRVLAIKEGGFRVYHVHPVWFQGFIRVICNLTDILSFYFLGF